MTQIYQKMTQIYLFKAVTLSTLMSSNEIIGEHHAKHTCLRSWYGLVLQILLNFGTSCKEATMPWVAQKEKSSEHKTPFNTDLFKANNYQGKSTIQERNGTLWKTISVSEEIVVGFMVFLLTNCKI